MRFLTLYSVPFGRELEETRAYTEFDVKNNLLAGNWHFQQKLNRGFIKFRENEYQKRKKKGHLL